MMMRFNEIHKFSDGTLQQIVKALDYRVKEFRINRMNPVGFNSLVHSLRTLSALRRSGLRTASTAAKPCQGDSSEFYLIIGSIHTDQRGIMVLATLFNGNFLSPEEISPPKDAETPVESSILVSPSSSVGSSSLVRSITPPPDYPFDESIFANLDNSLWIITRPLGGVSLGPVLLLGLLVFAMVAAYAS
nr:hypothetical protein [Tanacetum cinerariifolium]